MPKCKSKGNKKTDIKRAINLANTKRIEHRPWFVFSYREDLRNPEFDYQLGLTYTFDNDKYRCRVEVFGNTCTIVMGDNSPYINDLYKCNGVAQKYIVYSLETRHENSKYITYLIFFYDTMFDHCMKVIFIKFPDHMRGGNNRASKYILFSVNNLRRKDHHNG
jgi:hypothetical protein